MTAEKIILDKRDHVGVVILNRPNRQSACGCRSLVSVSIRLLSENSNLGDTVTVNHAASKALKCLGNVGL